MDHFLFRFSALCEKTKKIYGLEVEIFGKMHDRIPFFLAFRSSVRGVQMPFEGLSSVKTLVKFGNVYAADPLLQNKTEIGLPPLTLTFAGFTYNPLWTMLN